MGGITPINGVIIDVGHGGTDSGAICSSFKEKDMNLKISLYQFARYKELGVPVKITRTTDVALDSKTRTKIVRDSNMKVCISNHINAGGGDGAETIHSIHSSGKLAHAILNELVLQGQNKRRVFTRSSESNKAIDYYFMHRETGAVETIIVEYGFLDSVGDDVKQLINDWEKYAEATVKAVTMYLGYEYEKPLVVKPNEKPVEKPVATKPVEEKYYRVVVGSFKSKSEADKFLAGIKLKYADAFIHVD